MGNDILERIEAGLTATGKSAAAASVEAGLSQDAIRNMQRAARRGQRLNVTVDTLQKLAPVLNMTLGDLIADARIVPEDGLRPIAPRMVSVPVVGRVAAGHYYAVDEQDQSDVDHLFMPPDPKFPNARQIAFEVSGDSMNDLKPRPLFPGDKVICVAFEDVAHVMPVIDGMVVVVQRTRDGGHIREWSVKQVEMKADQTLFHPRSTNPKHKPIVVDRDMTSDEGTAVEILAIVRRAVSDVPLS